MGVLFVTHPDCAGHDTGYGHPERPARLEAVTAGAAEAEVDEALVPCTPRQATRAEIERVHEADYVSALERFCQAGGGALDADTSAVPASWEAALAAAGAGLSAAERLRSDSSLAAAFCAVRPPGHHAVPARAMGFCLFNNVAVTAAALAAVGERVLVVDIDAHHGNGTQEAFYGDGDVAYVSFHQSPLYPGSGSLEEVGEGDGRGWTMNLPLPPGATGDVYRDGIEEVVAPMAEEHGPEWLLLSAGFDAHRSDPLTDMGLSAGDYADITGDLLGLVAPGRCLAFLEGGYNLDALRSSTAATLAAMLGEIRHDEAPTGSGPGSDVVAAAAAARR